VENCETGSLENLFWYSGSNFFKNLSHAIRERKPSIVWPLQPCRIGGLQPASFGAGNDPQLARTQSYARLFMVPGMYHCLGGPGPNMFDALTPLVSWVEQGRAPETIIATKFVNDTPPAVEMTRPLCVYPKVARYNGSGSTSVAANFTCVADEPDFNQTPAPKYGRERRAVAGRV
jgi:hypothetical protein